jgi:hypothetical protein
MSARHLPVRPNLEQLRHQAKDLLRQARRSDQAALAEITAQLSETLEPSAIKLSQVQHALARSYGVASWPRLVLACRLTDAIWEDDVDAICQLVAKHPQLVHEMANGNERSNWGAPLSYAANLGRDRVIRALAERGATDLEHALDRASLQGKIDTARMLHRMMGEPRPRAGCLNGPAYTLNVPGIELMLELGAQVHDEDGRLLAPVDVVLETDSRTPVAKHQILEAFFRAGVELPDTPTMALHRGRIDLLEEHLRRDPALLTRTFTHEEIYPPALGCHDEVLATQGTPLAGTTLLHMCVDYDEQEIARWLIARGMPVDAKAAVDADGFGGHTSLFGTVVSQPNFWMNYQNRPQVPKLTQLLLDHGADPNVRASLRKQLHTGYAREYDTSPHEYRAITPLAWGEQFHAKVFVSQPALQLIRERGGHD